jgi:hypothetical protein
MSTTTFYDTFQRSDIYKQIICLIFLISVLAKSLEVKKDGYLY